ncbi:hypothetical protein B0H10DRAFT_2200726 [Mycena sp. CBHHK59/15]|nr:hypothetical protein B0H10DRAFT_2200726 [Mycena sp. CBHHK59/15]
MKIDDTWARPNRSRDSGYKRGLDVQTYAGGSLYSLPSAFSGNTNIGLHEGTLYDVPVGNAGIGNLSVLATGFNFTCGYFKTVQLEVQTIMKFFRANVDGGAEFYNVDNTALGRLILSAQGVTDAGSPPTDNDAYDIIFFTNLTIVDSNGDAGIKVALDFKTSAQLLRCSLSLVEQTALVDTQSWKVVSLEPNIVKQSSAWVQAPSYPQSPAGQNTSSPLPMSSSSISLADLWQTWYILAPRAPSTISFPVSLPLPDLYLNHLLRLPISSGFFDDPSTSDNITLHDLENALSTLVASIIWTLTYVPPLPGYQQSMSTSSLNASLQTVRNLTSLVGLGRQGQGVLTEAVAQHESNLHHLAEHYRANPTPRHGVSNVRKSDTPWNSRTWIGKPDTSSLLGQVLQQNRHMVQKARHTVSKPDTTKTSLENPTRTLG